MERLTWRDKSGVAYPCPWALLPTLDETMKLFCKHLAAYEDIGLTPEDIEVMKRWHKGEGKEDVANGETDYKE